VSLSRGAALAVLLLGALPPGGCSGSASTSLPGEAGAGLDEAGPSPTANPDGNTTANPDAVPTAPGADAAPDPSPAVPLDAGAAEAAADAGAAAFVPVVVNGVLTGPGRMLTNRSDNARTGANLEERVLSQANAPRLALLDHWGLSSVVTAQVLVAEDVETRAGRRNLALVATLQNNLAAYDLDAAPGTGGSTVWRLGENGELGAPQLSSRLAGGVHGILGTPVVDAAAARVYLVARGGCNLAGLGCRQRLVAVDLGSGTIVEMVDVQGAVEVPDPAGAASVQVAFEPDAQWNRPALLLQGGRLYVAFSAGPNGGQHEEDFVFHGWIFAYEAAALSRPPLVYCTTPRGSGGAIWQGGSGPAADDGFVYVATGNGILGHTIHPPAEFPVRPRDQENSVVRLPAGGPVPRPADTVAQYWDSRDYRPDGNMFQFMESSDCEFASSGPVLIPGSRLLAVGSKPGILYLLDRDTMLPTQEPMNAFRNLPLQPGHTRYVHSWWGIPPIYQAPVFWRPDDPATRAPAGHGLLFAWAAEDKLKSFRLDYQTRTLQELATADVSPSAGGGSLVLTAAGGDPGSGVLWATAQAGAGPAGTLMAFDPATLRTLFFADLAAWSKFTPPTVARGRVIVPSTSGDGRAPREILVFGLRAGM
jgi:hypothetical protein